jgi:exonuclease VII large subunit
LRTGTFVPQTIDHNAQYERNRKPTRRDGFLATMEFMPRQAASCQRFGKLRYHPPTNASRLNIWAFTRPVWVVLRLSRRAAAVTLAEARERSQSLLREIVGQGPEKTLRRGFAVVSDVDRRTVTSAEALRRAGQMTVQFSDGSVPATVQGDTGSI